MIRPTEDGVPRLAEQRLRKLTKNFRRRIQLNEYRIAWMGWNIEAGISSDTDRPDKNGFRFVDKGESRLLER